MSAMIAAMLGGTVDDKGKGNAMMRGPGGAQKALEEEEGRRSWRNWCRR